MSRPNLSGETVADKYALAERIGFGHFGDVYIANHVVLKRRSAVKLIPVKGKMASMAELEPYLQHLTKHAHIVEVKAAERWVNGNEQFILIEMEYLPGGSLQGAIEANISIPHLAEVLKNVLFALEHAHGAGVVHRDVKPANILMSNGGKLSDFGIAMIDTTGASASEYVYNGNLAPECVKSWKFTAQSDIFATGLTLFRGLNLITNWRELQDAIPNWNECVEAGALVATIGFHPRVPQRVRRIVRRACHADPARRFATAADFRDALEKIHFARNWRHVEPGLWACDYEGAEERICVENVKGKHDVVYTRNGRRKAEECRWRLSFDDAHAHLFDLIAKTSL